MKPSTPTPEISALRPPQKNGRVRGPAPSKDAIIKALMLHGQLDSAGLAAESGLGENLCRTHCRELIISGELKQVPGTRPIQFKLAEPAEVAAPCFYPDIPVKRILRPAGTWEADAYSRSPIASDMARRASVFQLGAV